MRTPTSHENSANPRPFPQHLGDEKRRNRPHRDPEDTIKRRVRQETGWPCLVVGKSVSDVVAVTQ